MNGFEIIIYRAMKSVYLLLEFFFIVENLLIFTGRQTSM